MTAFLPISTSPFLGLLLVRSSERRLLVTRVSEKRRQSKVEARTIFASKQLPFLIEQIAAKEEEKEIDHDDAGDCDDEDDDDDEAG